MTTSSFALATSRPELVAAALSAPPRRPVRLQRLDCGCSNRFQIAYIRRVSRFSVTATARSRRSISASPGRKTPRIPRKTYSRLQIALVSRATPPSPPETGPWRTSAGRTSPPAAHRLAAAPGPSRLRSISASWDEPCCTRRWSDSGPGFIGAGFFRGPGIHAGVPARTRRRLHAAPRAWRKYCGRGRGALPAPVRHHVPPRSGGPAGRTGSALIAPERQGRPAATPSSMPFTIRGGVVCGESSGSSRLAFGS